MKNNQSKMAKQKPNKPNKPNKENGDEKKDVKVTEQDDETFGGHGKSPDDNLSDDDESDGGGSTKDGKKKKKVSKGGFHAMKLSEVTMGGVRLLGFKQPTPIQRKAIPPALLGRDIVAMARTGSGKTAAFLIPTIEKLQTHSQQGVRSVILSPTRELAQQTYKVARNLGRKTDLRFCLLQGGDSLEAQFDALAAAPDVLIATPGRLAHLLLEAQDLSLQKVDILVVDEADRLFEMGFQAQLQEIISRTPDSRQTLLFSATMPKLLAEFARVKLREPELIRLDTDVRVSDTLKLAFFKVRSAERTSALLHILRTQLDCTTQSTIVFCGTKHEVEFIGDLIRAADLIPLSSLKKESVSSQKAMKKPSGKFRGKPPRRDSRHNHNDDEDYEIYQDNVEDHKGVSIAHGSMDQSARTQALEKFRTGEAKIFVVTDLAARGLDIPHVNNVINFDFPDRSKLFVHRVGRAARQGRVGTAFSLVGQDEMGHLVDVMLYLGRPLTSESEDDQLMGLLPQQIIDDGVEWVNAQLSKDPVLAQLQKAAINAHKMYVKTRSEPSKRSIKRSKELGEFPIHPLFRKDGDHGNFNADVQQGLTLQDLASFRPKKTTFEIEQAKGGGSGGNNAGQKKKDSRALTFQRTSEFANLIRSREALKSQLAKSVVPTAAEESDVEEDVDQENIPMVTRRTVGSLATSVTVAAAEKVRLSAADRKKAKKRGIPLSVAVAEAVSNEKRQKIVAAPAPGQATGAFRDGKHFITNEATGGSLVDDAYESQLKINRIDDAVLDLTDDTDIAKTQRSYQWDKKKKKYIQSTLKDHVDAKRVRKAGAESIDVKNAGEAYEKWARKTRKRIGGVREMGNDDEADAETDVRKRSRMRKDARMANTPFLPGGRRLKEEVKNEEQIIKDKMTKRRESEKLKNKKKKTARGPRAGADAKAMRIGKQKPRPGQYSRSKLASGGGGNRKPGGGGSKRR